MTFQPVKFRVPLTRANADKAKADAAGAETMKALGEERGIKSTAEVAALFQHPDPNIRAAAIADITAIANEHGLTPDLVRASQEADAIVAEAFVRGVDSKTAMRERNPDLANVIPVSVRELADDQDAALATVDGDEDGGLGRYSARRIGAIPAGDPRGDAACAFVAEQLRDEGQARRAAMLAEPDDVTEANFKPFETGWTGAVPETLLDSHGRPVQVNTPEDLAALAREADAIQPRVLYSPEEAARAGTNPRSRR